MCVCGRSIGDEERQVIRKRATEFLDTEETATINAMKKDITKYVEQDGPQAPVVKFNDLEESLFESIKKIKDSDNEITRLINKQIEQGDDELKRWESDYEYSKDRKIELEGLLYQINSPGNDALEVNEQNSLRILEKLRIENTKKIAEITDTLMLHRRTEIVRAICDHSIEIARFKIRNAILTKCNNMLSRILSSDPLQLQNIGKSLILDGQSSGSVGQVLSVGYAFLLTALKHGDNDFPLIVDSPAGSLDDARRKEIGKLIPKHCSQFITFLISTEREHFVDSLESAATHPILYLTAFRDSPGVQHLIDTLPPNLTTRGENSVAVLGRDYFTNFSLAEEV